MVNADILDHYMMKKLLVAVETHRHKCIGSVVRCASAFGASMVAVVGHIDFSTHGAHGAQMHIQFIHFYYWSELRKWCVENDFDIFGMTNTILNEFNGVYKSQSVDNSTFSRSTCVIVGDKDGLRQQQLDIVSTILHVNVPNGESLIPYDSKLAICLQQIAVQIELTPSHYDGEKHVLSNITRKLGIIRGSDVSKLDNKDSVNVGDDCDIGGLFDEVDAQS